MKKYTEEHEWAELVSDDVAIIGVTEFAVESLGDVTLVDIIDLGSNISSGDIFGDIESVKAVSELYSPLDGEIVEINEKLLDCPELVNESPLNEGWIIKIKLSKPEQYNALMDKEQYDKLTEDI